MFSESTAWTLLLSSSAWRVRSVWPSRLRSNSSCSPLTSDCHSPIRALQSRISLKAKPSKFFERVPVSAANSVIYLYLHSEFLTAGVDFPLHVPHSSGSFARYRSVSLSPKDLEVAARG